MILDARLNKQAALYRVFDCDISNYRNDVVWVDDEESCYGIYCGINPAGDGLKTKSISARILIMPEVLLVYINPKMSKDELVRELTDIVLEGEENESVKPV